MSFQLTTEDKIDLFQMAYNAVDDYSDECAGLLARVKFVLEALLRQEEDCRNPEQCIEDLEILILGFELKIRKKESFESVMSQVSFDRD